MMKNILSFIAASLLVATAAMAQQNPVAATDGNKYVPYAERTGNESIVYFTRNHLYACKPLLLI